MHRTRVIALAVLAAALMAGPQAARAQTTIGSGFPTAVTGFDAWTGCLAGYSCWYVGQTFTAPNAVAALTQLSIGFGLQQYQYDASSPSYNPFEPRLTVMQWDGTTGVGTALASEQLSAGYDLYTSYITGGGKGFRFTWDFGSGLAVSPNEQYLAFVTNPTLLDGISDARPDFGASAYDGGYAVLANTSLKAYDPAQQPATWGKTGFDLAFSGTFTSKTITTTPEPNTALLMLTGLACLALLMRRRRSLPPSDA